MSEALFETIQTFVFMIEIVLYAGCFYGKALLPERRIYQGSRHDILPV